MRFLLEFHCFDRGDQSNFLANCPYEMSKVCWVSCTWAILILSAEIAQAYAILIQLVVFEFFAFFTILILIAQPLR